MEQLRNLLGQFDPARANLYLWTGLLLLGIPALLLLLSEWIDRWQRQTGGVRERLTGPLAQLRNLVLPLLSLRLILEHILQIENSAFSVRLVETMLWLMILYSGLSLLTQLVRSPGSVGANEFAMPRVWGELLRMALVLGVSFYILGALWGAPMEQVFAALGVGSIVIGFALQDTLSSLVAGLFLAFEKPFQVGDWLRYGAYEGQVIEMNWRAVRLRTRERDVVILPNALMGKEAVINFTLFDPLHAELIQVSFGYNHPPNQIKRLLLETCLATPGVVHDPAPHIRVHSYAYDKQAINYEIKLFVLDYLRTEFIRDEILTRVYYAAQRNNLQLPYSTAIHYQGDSSALTRGDEFAQRLEQLRALPYFAVQPPAVVEQLARQAEFYNFGAEEWILADGAFFTGFYIMLTGEVRLVAPEAVRLPTSRNGALATPAPAAFDRVASLLNTQPLSAQVFEPTKFKWREVTRLHGGDFFGELLLRRDQPAPYAVEVTQDTRALFIPRISFIEIVETTPRLATEMNLLIEERAKLLQRVNDEKG
jgi:small-conductance mechanosensitive channel/CRP-like cAMP-binding protein